MFLSALLDCKLNTLPELIPAETQMYATVFNL